MKICLVSAFPPSCRGLNEYGFHIARELQRNPLLSLTILADELPAPALEIPDFTVIRCWDFNRLSNPFRLLREVRKLRPDVVWFNIGFASYGNKALPACAGLTIPALVRLAGFQTHVTLHQLMDTVDLKDAGVKFPRLYKLAGEFITRALLMSDSVSVLLPAYRRILREKYRAGYVHVRPHGIFAGHPEYPDFSRRGNPFHRVLAFGKWGTYKRLEPLLEAFRIVAQEIPSIRLVIAGSNHPNTPGYVESVAERHRNDPRIEFTGYVPEEQIADLFRSASVSVMPYSSSAGSSGVAHIACQYGVPILASDIRDFRQLANEEGLAIEFFAAGNVHSLTRSLAGVLQSSEAQQKMALQNFSVALHMTMPRVIREYLRSFDLKERVEALRSISRLRRLPRWMPLRSTVGLLLLRNWARWRSCLPSPHILQHDTCDLSYGQGNGSGTLDAARSTANGNGKHSGLAAGCTVLAGACSSATSAQEQQAAGQQDQNNRNHEFPPAVLAEADDDQCGNPQARQSDSVERMPAAQVFRLPGNGNGAGGNAKHGGNGATPGHDAVGRKRTTHSPRKTGAGERDRAIETSGLGSNRDTGAA